MSTNAEITAAYAQWAERLHDEGWTPYLLTFMFRPLSGSPERIRRQMEGEVERVYATFLPRIIRKPTARASRGRLPVWFCWHDRPVHKHSRQSVRDVVVNDGQHMHATGFIPPWSRLQGCLAEHFVDNQHVYVRPAHLLDRLDIEPITKRLGYVVGYARKHVGRSLLGEDATLILPRTSDEVRPHSRTPPLSAQPRC